jgi:general secretion pathway protein J
MNQRGLTLVEVLIALAIFAVVNAMGVGIFTIAARGAEQLERVEQQISEIERLRGLLRQDIGAVVDRQVIEADARELRPAFVGGRTLADLLPSEDQPLLALVRSGWRNPAAQAPRSELQAVTYLIEDGKLIRRIRPFLDASFDTPVADDVLIEGVSEVEISFRLNGRWLDETGVPGGDGEMPRAVQLTFTHPVYGEIETIFLVPRLST